MLHRLCIGLLLVAVCAVAVPTSAQPDSTATAPDDPLRLAVAGMVHGHVHGFLQARPYEGVRVVGVAEADTALLARRADQYDIAPTRRYRDLESLLEATEPDAVVTFTHTFDHRRVVETAARHGVDVMVEKPLAVNMEHARAIREAAETHDIHVLTNYETTWYPSTQRVYEIARTEERLGPLRKVIVRDGHRGPKEIGVGPAFLEWLTDPTLNGGGALTDFGCYGANLLTRLMEGRRPLSVTAVTQQLKDDPVYRRVDDVATILLTYPGGQGIIQASWNWPFSRKDLSVYGQRGYVHADDATHLRLRVRGEIEPGGLSSLSNNMLVTEILDAARRSARTGETVRLETE